VRNVDPARFLSALRDMGVDSYLADGGGAEDLFALRRRARACTRCSLAATRRHVVFGEGAVSAHLVFVGEAPGEEEDIQGRPFVGRAGKVLNGLIGRLGLGRGEVYICNVLKCRPPNNRDPEPAEVGACKEYLLGQLDLLDPKVICTLGRHAYNALLGVDERITRIRGQVTRYGDVTLLPTYHPSFLLRNPERMTEAMEDMDHLRQLLKD
jgi:DNA polymerase